MNKKLLDIDKLIPCPSVRTARWRFSTLLDIDKLILLGKAADIWVGFSTLLDIDKLIRWQRYALVTLSFSTLLDIDKLTCVLVITEKLVKVLLNSGAFFIFEKSKKSTASLATNCIFFV